MMRRTAKHTPNRQKRGPSTPRTPTTPHSPVIAGSSYGEKVGDDHKILSSSVIPSPPSSRGSVQRRKPSALPLILWILLPVNPVLLIGLHVYHAIHHRRHMAHPLVVQGVITRNHAKVILREQATTTEDIAVTRATKSASEIQPIPTTKQQQQQEAVPSQKASRTVVTAFFPVKSKYGKSKYEEWIETFLSLKDAMVIFLPKDDDELKDSVVKMRKHAPTRIIQMNLEDVPLAKDNDISFWETQFRKDPEKKRHASYQLFWIWLSKTWWMAQAIEQNPFQSDLWMWSDIGCFRGAQGKNYVGKEMMAKAQDIVPTSSMLFMSHKESPEPPNSLWWHRKLREPQHFYHSGTMMAGYGSVVKDFHQAFVHTLNGFRERNLFLGDDQVVLQCTCLQNPAMCAYVTRDQVRDNHYFGLRFALHHGGNYTLWRPPPTNAIIADESAARVM